MIGVKKRTHTSIICCYMHCQSVYKNINSSSSYSTRIIVFNILICNIRMFRFDSVLLYKRLRFRGISDRPISIDSLQPIFLHFNSFLLFFFVWKNSHAGLHMDKRITDQRGIFRFILVSFSWFFFSEYLSIFIAQFQMEIPI